MPFLPRLAPDEISASASDAVPTGMMLSGASVPIFSRKIKRSASFGKGFDISWAVQYFRIRERAELPLSKRGGEL